MNPITASTYQLTFNLFGVDIPTKPFVNLKETEINAEKIEARIVSSPRNIFDYFTQVTRPIPFRLVRLDSSR